jgi:DNA-binding transcriptional regulator YhcF (GntR family)
MGSEESSRMSLVHIDTTGGVAPYEQVRAQIAGLVTTGELEPGQRLPTVRQLAADLGLAANTVARAYRELEADGVISTRGRHGTFVHSPVLDTDATPADATAAATGFATTARRLGLSLAESIRLIENAWKASSA